MRTRMLILLAVVTAAALCGAAVAWCGSAGDPIYDCKVSSALLPTLPVDASARPYDVQRYELDLRLDPGLRRIDGSVTVTLRFLDGGGGDNVVLDLVDDLTVSGVLRDGQPVSFVHAGDSLLVTAPETIPAGGQTTVVVSYGGRPPRHGELSMGLVFRDRSPSPDIPVGPVVFNVSEPASSHAWWPCHDVPSDKATVRLALTVPDTLTAVANGLMVADAPADPGWRTTVWESSTPMPPYLVGLSVSEFVAWEESCSGGYDDVLLTYHAFPEDEDVARAFFAPTCEAMAFLEDIAGPYPFADERYGQMEIKWGGAMEHQTSTSVGNALIHTPALFLNAVVHELAHQWFGDMITPASWRDIWLNEGFARYCEALWAERNGGRSAYLAFLHKIGPERHPALFRDEGLLTDPSPILRSLVYDKGAWVLHMLREHLGDDVFFDLLHDYAGDPALRYGTVDTDAFVAHASAAAGRDMGPWFDPWLGTDEVPTLAWSWQAFPTALRDDGVIIDIAQQQLTLFELEVPVYVVAGGDTTRHVLACDGPATRRRIVADAPVTDVLLDPEGTLLLTTAPLPAPGIAITAVRPNPVGADGARVDFSLLHDGAVTVTVYDVRGREMGSWELGVLAGGADHTWTWPGRGERRWAAGVYWLEAASGGARAVRKVVTVH